MSDLTELHQLIGSMKADMAHVRSAVDVINTNMSSLTTTSIKHEMKITSVHARVDKIEPIVKELKYWKTKAMVYTSTACGVITFLGVCIKEYIFSRGS